MIDAAAAIATTLATAQAQADVVALRLDNAGQRQIVDLLAEGMQQTANPDHLGNQIDTWA